MCEVAMAKYGPPRAQMRLSRLPVDTVCAWSFPGEVASDVCGFLKVAADVENG